MPTYLQLYRLAAVGLTALLFTSCASTAPSRLYVLYSPEELAPISSDIDSAFRWVAVGPIRFPAELERPLVITQSAEGELAYSEVHRWGSSIDRQLEQVLLKNISVLLDSPGGVHRFPGPEAAGTDYRVAVSIDELTGQLGQSGIPAGPVDAVSAGRDQHPDQPHFFHILAICRIPAILPTLMRKVKCWPT